MVESQNRAQYNNVQQYEVQWTLSLVRLEGITEYTQYKREQLIFQECSCAELSKEVLRTLQKRVILMWIKVTLKSNHPKKHQSLQEHVYKQHSSIFEVFLLVKCDQDIIY